ncbi:purD: phosphoribosylamine--glycine ligase [Rubrobacter radiotolerans]|uniref:Phosphoribosylamine--glycine ligase n=1 Tax=Rubrobacter radiotolerans TaxID=42256 RepID=A0A023X146_RUBRA|nr:phosphoribosylamine--glycine ligase [Rubrobacter radiotolerans]AHY46187.1 purD: phosphoribosylamine--glycine ligase [Rubrobacter radiotolerans]MDX5893596.1 phosphoribosylamine--glycine ligase [Rubrobacter radiotolerans]SMC04078.1 phosphoribosylamine--glycine ligase [Rubrobacter radiotolerans DSM 5868]
MRVLVVGSGGREHALVEAIAASHLEPEVFAAPGNPGIAKIAEVADIPADDLVALRDFAKSRNIDLTVVGPEVPLIGGISECFWEEGLQVFGPSRAAARIEGSKVFSKEMMRHAGVPTADFEVFDRPDRALDYLRSKDEFPIVLKADGVASGKGVTVARTLEEAEEAVRETFGGRFGAAGERMVVEECLLGREASVFVMTDGENILPFLPAQDYKPIFDGNEGPNTGGMGAYSPLMWMDPITYGRILEEIIRPTLHQLALIGAPYSGLLYAGVMVTESGPKALEFNCRFGDPETQAILPRMGSDLLELMLATNEGRLAGREIEWSADKAVCVVLASEGYPESSHSGDEIQGLGNLPAGVYVYHAGTEERDGRFYTNGGRVLNIVGTGPTVLEARARAYAAVESIHFEGMQYRTDIALEAIELEEI